MPTYHYRCDTPDCGIHWYDIVPIAARDDQSCPECGTPHPSLVLHAPAIIRSMPGHFNHTAGEYVSSQKQFADSLKRQSEEATIRTGVEHDFRPVDLRDRESLGVTDDGLEATEKRLVDEGRVETRRSIVLPPGSTAGSGSGSGPSTPPTV